MLNVQLADYFPVDIDEDVLRRLCGPATFARADAMERGGHVLLATLQTDALTGTVRGVWRRADKVSITARARKMSPNCTRHGTGYCCHVGALLLHWLRSPSVFFAQGNADYLLADDFPQPARNADRGWGADRPALLMAEIAEFLSGSTTDELRALARRFGFRASGSKKSDVLSSVVAVFADEARLDSAIAEMSAAERLTADAIDLTGFQHVAERASVVQAYEAMGGPDRIAIDGVVGAGLALVDHAYDESWPGYVVPLAVSARLPAIDYLWAPISGRDVLPERRESGALGIVELFQVIALSVLSGDIEQAEVMPRDRPPALPTGLSLGEEVSDQTFRIVAQPILAEASLAALEEITQASRAHVHFAARLMSRLNILRVGPETFLRSEHLRRFLELAPGDRASRLIDAWLMNAGEIEIGYLPELGTQLRIAWKRDDRAWSYPFDLGVHPIARLVAKLISRLEPYRWQNCDAMTRIVWQLSYAAFPGYDQLLMRLAAQRNLEISHVGANGRSRRLSVTDENDWRLIFEEIVTATMQGPLRWLGLIDLAEGEDGATQVRALPPAGILSGREIADRVHRGSGRIAVEDDLTILIPSGTTDMTLHSQVTRIAELVGASPDGLRYQMTPKALHGAIDTGMTGSQIIDLIADLTGQAPSQPVTHAIQRYWEGYGGVRLYDELALIELADDVIGPELLAATRLAEGVVHAFSPRLLALDPVHVADVVTMLTERGHAPRVIDPE
ncbi:MAG: helicase-associated domain-containing protein [Thermomicrobiales bacterium]|nr:helicase-associated domain-containing protein [Thermomicrobiales bacterium]